MLRAGFASIDITPHARQSLIGYDFRWSELPPGNDGVHDPLYARVLVLHDGKSPAVLVSLDLCVLEIDLARHLRRAVARKIGAAFDRVVVSAIHTHSGPFPRLPAARKTRGQSKAAAQRRKLGEEYAAFLEGRLVDAAARASGLTYPVGVSAVCAPLGIGYTRRVRTRDGIKHCWNPLEFPDLVPDVSPDPTCTVVALRQPAGSRKFVLWSAGAHPVVLGKTSRVVSADWPGAACDMIDRSVAGARSMFLLGAAGEVHPWIATQEDPAQIEPVASAASSLVRLMVESGAGRFEPDPSFAIATRTWKCGQRQLDLAAWRIGPALLLFAPVELFASLSRELRARLKSPAIIATVSNGWCGYWPDKAAFAEGQYEVDATWGIKAGDGERLIAQMAELAEEVDGSGVGGLKNSRRQG
jgi:hypothetical protein